MMALTPQQPSGSTAEIGTGMEQFHHPRPVCTGRGPASRPTPEREHLLAGLAGRVVEIGAGDGVKLTCYPPDVTDIVLVEPDPFLRSTAAQIADSIPASVQIIDGTTTRIPVADGSCDAVVCALVLCCAPLKQTLAEIRRVLRPGGQLRFYEHVRSANPILALAETLVTPIWARASGGCHPACDPVAAIHEAGFILEDVEHRTVQHVSHVVGIALTPSP
ncbi:class I SAM-dependent methyltransferase [Nonomuraea sp. NPDC059007]|uniref:class I SAM-dependent methyltransferase n=1 Tax=Nonomuraea sp. NPDC059007 TaxID=3346692 RepID=UPI003683B80A